MKSLDCFEDPEFTEKVFEIVQYPLFKTIQADDPVAEEQTSMLHIAQRHEVVNSNNFSIIRNRVSSSQPQGRKQRNIKVQLIIDRALEINYSLSDVIDNFLTQN